MNRMFSLVAIAAVVISSPAAAEGIKVSLVGKSSEQINSEIRSAARTVCKSAVRYDSMPLDSYVLCVKETFKVAVTKVELARANVPASTLAQN